MKNTFTVLALLILSSQILGCEQTKTPPTTPTTPKAQKRVFSVTSIEYKGYGTGEYAAQQCKTGCRLNANSESIDEYLSQNWRVIASSPKQFPVDSDCTCVGTEYIIEK